MPWDAADHAALTALLRAHAVRTGHFVLASGQTSNVYCDVKKVSLRADGAWLIGRGLLALAREADPSAQAVGGLTLGADPLISAVSVASAHEGAPLHGIIVRKQIKDHGTGQGVEAAAGIAPGARVIALDDVVTTAGSTLTAITRLRDAGFIVEHAVCVLDREGTGRQALADAGVSLRALTTLSQLLHSE